MEHEFITEQIIAAAYKVHNTPGSGYLEKVYENAMVIELQKRGFRGIAQHPIPVACEGHDVGDYYADLLVEEYVIVELKAVENLPIRHEAQLVNYLTSTGLDIGLLINFSASVAIKRKYRVYKKTG